MSQLTRVIVLAGLAVLPGSCNAAAPVAPPPKPKQVVATPSPAPRPAPPHNIGAFRLSRAPEQGGVALGYVPTGTKRLVVEAQDVPFDADGRFIVGFGRDHSTVVRITAYLADGSTVSDKLNVAPRSWKIDHLKTLPRFGQPSAEFQARRPGELAQINAARRLDHKSGGWRQPFIWPAKGRISGVFGSQRIYAGEPGAPHSGVDVAGGAGAPVVAPADGVVILAAAAPFTLEGNLLMIDHGMGLNTAFLHLSRIDVKAGDVVKQGQRVGAIGATGRATGPHLHWGMKWNNERIDPARLAGAMQ